MKNVHDSITDLLALAIKANTTASLKERQAVKMKAGKVRRFLKSENEASNQYASGVKPSN